MFSRFILVALLLALVSAEVSKITAPQKGDRITTGIDLEIRWESTSSKDPVRIELKKGQSHNLTTVHTISTETPNNGTYHWRSRDDRFLRALSAKELPNAPTSGCDYVISIREAQNTAYSGYFTIINLNDDGLNPNIPCPSTAELPKIEGGDGGGSTGGQNIPNGKLMFDESICPCPNARIGSGTTQGSVSTAMLGGAVGGAAAGLLFIFAAILLLGRRRNWFIREDYIEQLVQRRVMELKPAPVVVQSPPQPQVDNPYTYTELSGHHTYQLAGTPTER
ncbi:hypothetical protein AJ79_06141 [Helicocarpus griseus UAMH5409]|uniref:Yeast cell wall synthesis Kre9/Knh1-like N-terminal domain-containing protein n=1 Tax=Helicocarpus griseus UAMH5409 TaxID=1447875 RepID=A0A2B7XGP1_9EURO|nr:hypothetical protein AJ79_06141 [Helicocarpus griseus UAMH5409]